DPLERHAYTAVLRWSGARGRPDWQAAYAYARWRPTLFVDASDDTDPFRDGTVRSREVNAGGLLRIARVRWIEAALVGGNGSTDRFDCATCGPGGLTILRERSLRLGWSVDDARTYGYSISPEEGGRVSFSAEVSRQAFGAPGDAEAF